MWAGGSRQIQMAELTALLERRLLRGEHLTLYGPRGSGKSTVLTRLYARLQRNGIPCAYSPATVALDDITRALERAYPTVNTLDVGRRTARLRLWYAADRRCGVLLLDHFHCTGSAMVSCLRRLHGRIAGVLTAMDVEGEVERCAMRPWRFGAMSVRMPLATARQLGRLLDERWRTARLPRLAENAAHAFVAAAHGRPGWITQCIELACERRYWCAQGPLVTVLCIDTEAQVRYRALAMVRAEPAAERGGECVGQESSSAGGRRHRGG